MARRSPPANHPHPIATGAGRPNALAAFESALPAPRDLWVDLDDEGCGLDNVVFVLTHRDLASFNPLRFYIVRSGQVHRNFGSVAV